MAGRILIADNLATNRIILKARLSAAAYEVVQAATGAEAVAAAAANSPDIVLVTDGLPDIGAGALCRRLHALAGMLPVPVLVLTADATRAARLELLEAGADAVLSRLPEDAILRARIRSLMRRSASERELSREAPGLDGYAFAEPAQEGFLPPARIALVAPTHPIGLKWRSALAGRLRDQVTVLDPDHALVELNREPPPDAVVIAEHPDRAAYAQRLLSDLRCRSETLRSTVIFVQDAPDTDRAVMALDLGASDLVDQGFDAGELAFILRRELARKARDERHRAALRDGLRLAATDPLTGLFNRRYAMSQLDRVIRNARARGEGFAVMALDLDHFKHVNDSFGHAAGDAVLTSVADRMRSAIRAGDFVARIGGEEFLAVIRGCGPAEARTAAERLRQVVAGAPVPLLQAAVRVTVSVGLIVGDGTGAMQEAAALIDQADRALYAAKAAGRNRVVVGPVPSGRGIGKSGGRTAA